MSVAGPPAQETVAMYARQPQQPERPPGNSPAVECPTCVPPPKSDTASLKLFHAVQALLAPYGVPNVHFIAPCRHHLIERIYWEAHPAPLTSGRQSLRKRLDDPDAILERVGPPLTELLGPLRVPFGRIVIEVLDNRVVSLLVEHRIRPGESLPPAR